MRTRLSERLSSPWLTVRSGALLGLLFVAAAAAKIADPPGFAQEVYNYALLPGEAVNAVALGLPWLELICGAALFLGVWKRPAAAIVALMLLLFIGALSINLARGRPVDCGCFGTSSVVKTDAQRFSEMRWAILRDVGMLALAIQILYATRRRPDQLGSRSGSRLPD